MSIQNEAMNRLQQALSDDLKHEPLSYIKANAIVNKAVSSYFGLDKLAKKGEMTLDMLALRNQVLSDYIKLFEVIENSSVVKCVLYAKYKRGSI